MTDSFSVLFVNLLKNTMSTTTSVNSDAPKSITGSQYQDVTRGGESAGKGKKHPNDTVETHVGAATLGNPNEDEESRDSRQTIGSLVERLEELLPKEKRKRLQCLCLKDWRSSKIRTRSRV